MASLQIILWSFGWFIAAVSIYFCVLFSSSEALLSFGVFYFLAIGYSQYIMLQALHETIHQVVVRKSRWSLLVGVLHYFPLGLTRNYAHIHMAHHRYFGQPELDPDHQTYSEYPKSCLDLCAILFSHLTGYTTLKQLLSWQQQAVEGQYRADKFFIVLFQLALLLAAWSVGKWWVYLFWAIPIVTVVKALGYLRIVAEHGDEDGRSALRSFRGSPFLSSVLGPFGFIYHAEHHLSPEIPYARISPSSASEKIEPYDGSHLHFWIRLIRSLRWSHG